MTDKFKPIQNVPKTYEQFILEDQQLTSEQKQNLYPDLVHEDIGSNKGYGPCNRSDCSCSPEELRRQARELNELADERTPFVSFTVEVVNSSGSG